MKITKLVLISNKDNVPENIVVSNSLQVWETVQISSTLCLVS